jgi:DNA-binding IclR family transcriptional regulator
MPEGALQRAVQLLVRVGDRPAELTVAELASDTGMPTSTAYRLLAELEEHGLVQRGADRTVGLGTRLVVLGRTAEEALSDRLVEPARAIMSKLAHELGETAILTAPCGLEGIVLHIVEGERQALRLSYARFRRAPMHRGASGKILAAYLERAERERLLEAVCIPELAAQLDRIRRDGFAFTVEELDEGAAAVAAPILDRRGRVIAGISLAGPAQRIAAGQQRATAAVIGAARAIERAHAG